MYRVMYGEEACSSNALCKQATFPKSPRVPQPGKLSEPFLWVYVEASLHRHDWLNHWLLVIDWTRFPAFPPWKLQGRGSIKRSIKNSKLLITWLGLLATSPIFRWPRAFPKVTSSTSQKYVYDFHQGFYELCARNRIKTKYIFLIVNHTVTPSHQRLHCLLLTFTIMTDSARHSTHILSVWQLCNLPKVTVLSDLRTQLLTTILCLVVA